jgi:hypothetical protein
MNERFKQVLEEASKRVGQWPEWKKSEALRLSEQADAPGKESVNQAEDQTINNAAKDADS